jgi:hypothetical protein
VKRKYTKIFLTVALAVVLTFSLGSLTEVEAFPAMSPDGKTCTPCHAEGFTGEHHDEPVTEPTDSTGSTEKLEKLHPIFNLETNGLYVSDLVEWDQLWEATPSLPVYSYPTGQSPWDEAWK